MDDDVRRLSVKFMASTGRHVDLELFDENDAWGFLLDLHDDYLGAGARLSDGQLHLLRDLGVALGMRPGFPLRGYVPALERAFGPTLLEPRQLDAVVRYIYIQVNGGGDFEAPAKPKVALHAEPFTGKPKRRGG